MTIKKCACGHKIQTKKAKVIGVTKMAGKRVLWVNCPSCDSTAVVFGFIKSVAA